MSNIKVGDIVRTDERRSAFRKVGKGIVLRCIGSRVRSDGRPLLCSVFWFEGATQSMHGHSTLKRVKVESE